MSLITIYSLTDPKTGLVRYIGKTKQTIVDRMYCHVSNNRLNREVSYKNSWIKSLKLKGLRPIAEEIDKVPQDEWAYWEKFYIQLFRAWNFPLTNMTNGGEGANLGKGCRGYRHTEEAKRRISEGNKGIVKTKEWIEKVSQAKWKPVSQYSIGGRFIRNWGSASEVAKDFEGRGWGKAKNIAKLIAAVIKRKRNYTYGYHWKAGNYRGEG